MLGLRRIVVDWKQELKGFWRRERWEMSMIKNYSSFFCMITFQKIGIQLISQFWRNMSLLTIQQFGIHLISQFWRESLITFQQIRIQLISQIVHSDQNQRPRGVRHHKRVHASCNKCHSLRNFLLCLPSHMLFKIFLLAWYYYDLENVERLSCKYFVHCF